MIDLLKRNVLITMVAASVLSALPATNSLATPDRTGEINKNNSVRPFGVSDLLIRIETNVIEFTNLTERRIEVKHFAPGSVRWQGNYTDLNALRSLGGIALLPHASSKVPAQIVKRPLADAYSIWADDAVVIQKNGRQSVLLGAYTHQQLLHVFPIPALNSVYM